MSLELSFQSVGAGPPLVVLHGLFGSARNWTSLARRWGEGRRVVTVDLRNHGASPWADEMSYRAMAADVAALLRREGLEGAAVLGHSMGGKTAMLLALEDPALVGRLIVVDIAPLAYGHSHGPLIAAMAGVDLSAAGRRGDVDQALAAAIPEAGLRSFLLQNLVNAEGRLAWRLNLAALDANMGQLTGFPDDLGAMSFAGPALFLAGGDSDYVPESAHGTIRRLFPAAEIAVIPGAGHWVHAERPDEMQARVADFLAG